MDGSTLAEPYRFTFRVRGPRVLAGLPGRPGPEPPGSSARRPLSAGAERPGRFRLLARLVYLEMNRSCPVPGVIALQPGAESSRFPRTRPGNSRKPAAGSATARPIPLRRVVTLTPERPLPYGCTRHLVVPPPSTCEQPGELQRWPIETYGHFELTEAIVGRASSVPPAP